MRSFFARRILHRFSQRYGYNTGYLEMLLKEFLPPFSNSRL